MTHTVAATRYAGSRIKRVEDVRLLTGRGTYVDDVSLRGAVYAAFVRSPHAHARIVSLDTARGPRFPECVPCFRAGTSIPASTSSGTR